MSEPPVLVYLETDDEVTTVVRRLRAADAGPTVLVVPGRSRATSSVVALRLLARAAERDGRALSIVGDPLTRSLAAEAGLPAYATIEEARSGGVPKSTPAPGHASIAIVRGPAIEDAAPTLAAIPSAAADDVTRPSPTVRPPPLGRRSSVASDRARRAGVVRLLPLAVLAVVLLAGGAAAALVLPAATVTIQPRTDEIGPVAYTISPRTERRGGTVTSAQEVTATGTYVTQTPAAGTVVLFNWTFVPVEVPAGTFVAAGEQAFATQATVTVPRGSLTSQGTIAAGDIEVAVVAAATGPAGNVAAEAINVVVNDTVDARLRGFPENPQPRVRNPAPTAGGVDATGPELTQEDVDAAVAALRETLEQAADAAVADAGDGALRVVPPRAEPTISGLEDLVGRRDEPTATISGELTWATVSAARDEVIELAEDRLRDDATVVPDGHRLVDGSISVTVGEPSLDGDELVVPVEVTAATTALVEESEVRARVAGRTAEAAEAALADLGPADVELWPGWVTTVPDADWRVTVRIVEESD